MRIDLLYSATRDGQGLYNISQQSESSIEDLYDDTGSASAALHALSRYLEEFAKNALDRSPDVPQANLSITVESRKGLCTIEITDDSGLPFSDEFIARINKKVKPSFEAEMAVDYSEIVAPYRAYPSLKQAGSQQLGGAGIGLSRVNTTLIECGGKLQVRNSDEGAFLYLVSPLEAMTAEDFQAVAKEVDTSYVRSAVSIPFVETSFEGRLTLPADVSQFRALLRGNGKSSTKRTGGFFPEVQADAPALKRQHTEKPKV